MIVHLLSSLKTSATYHTQMVLNFKSGISHNDPGPLQGHCVNSIKNLSRKNLRKIKLNFRILFLKNSSKKYFFYSNNNKFWDVFLFYEKNPDLCEFKWQSLTYERGEDQDSSQDQIVRYREL